MINHVLLNDLFRFFVDSALACDNLDLLPTGVNVILRIDGELCNEDCIKELEKTSIPEMPFVIFYGAVSYHSGYTQCTKYIADVECFGHQALVDFLPEMSTTDVLFREGKGPLINIGAKLIDKLVLP